MELTEKEKCQKGQLYDANNDPELAAGNPCKVIRQLEPQQS